ncbi:hypothetical protein GGR52DRAFT_592680 [Hypoxylon sp. FL1284]|nr:hypothetical protein GGR52DRAFT_592680 [Hypoxylon sp. FL1284]
MADHPLRFALYRALLQQAPRIRLPDDLATAWGPRNPIQHLIRRAFRRNRTDTSPRLVYPALKAGYEILARLRSAAVQSSSSPSDLTPSSHYASILSFLRARLEERNRTLEAKKLHPPHSRNPPIPSSAPLLETVPLLVNVTPAPTKRNPNPKPVYATPSRPRPLSELGGTGRRKIPQLDMASDFPFLRTKKPQPRVLNRVLTQKMEIRIGRTRTVKKFNDELIFNAELEDNWERSVAALLKKKGSSRMRIASPDVQAARLGAQAITGDFKMGDTFRQTFFLHGITYLQALLNAEREDQVARADAMRRLIDEETALAEQEKVQETAERRKRREAKILELHGEGWNESLPDPKTRGMEIHSPTHSPTRNQPPVSKIRVAS